jgi:hypothetical protein
LNPEGGAPIVKPGDLDEPTSADHNREVHQRFLDATMPRLEALANLVKEARAAREHYGWLPDANSEAMRELAEESKFVGSWGTEPIRSCYSAAGVLLAAAEDHARSITELLFLDRAPLFGHVVLARSALESASRVLWLSQLGIGARTRVARSYTDALDNLYQLSRLPGDPVPWATVRRNNILEEARRQNFRVITKKGKVPAIQEERPSQTKLLRSLLAGGGDEELGALIYNYYSAVAHGSMYGLLQRFERTDQRNAISPLVTAALVVSSNDVNSVLSAFILGYARAVKEHFTLMGWDRDSWRQTYSDAHAALVRHHR